MYSVLSELRYNPTSECYSSVLCLDRYPSEPELQNIVKKTQIYRLSPFDVGSKCNSKPTCGNNLIVPATQKVATIEDLPVVMQAITAVGWRIDTQITIMLNSGNNSNPNLLFYISPLRF